MGYGFPAALGAQMAFPESLVIDIAGDDSIQMNIQELATATKYDLPVKIIILNNGYLGMVRQWQELFYDHRYEGTCLVRKEECPEDCYEPGSHCPVYIPDFVKVADPSYQWGWDLPVSSIPSLRRMVREAKRPISGL